METIQLANDRPTPEEFATARGQQKARRGHFSELALRLPRYAQAPRRFAHAPLICHESWIPRSPVRLGIPDLNLEDDTAQLVTTFADASASDALDVIERPWYDDQALQLLPRSFEPEASYRRLTEAIRSIEKPPWVMDPSSSRPSYALSGVESNVRQEGLRLTFRAAKYFDYIDCGELLAFELVLQWSRLSRQGLLETDEAPSILDKRLLLRQRVGNWTDIAFRPSVAGVNVLTVFVDSTNASGNFPMMQRSATLGSAMGALHVIPAGEFQPTTAGTPAFVAHCTLWQTILREFAEEILLDKEAKSFGLDMRQLADRGTIRPLLDLVRTGAWKAYFLGVALDPLTLKPEIMVVSCIDRKRFLDAVGGLLKNRHLPDGNDEGQLLLGPKGWGEILSRANAERYRDDVNTLPAGRGCIELFLEQAEEVLSGHSIQLG